MLLVLEAGAAQTPAPPTMPVFGRLSVRPREMATGTRTEQAGAQQLAVRDDVTADIYVPPQCVGTRRCPLVVALDYFGGNGPDFPRLADQYGMILLRDFPAKAPSYYAPLGVVDPGVPALMREMPAHDDQALNDLDTALTQILRTFAIDPEKIAIFGNSHSGAESTFLGSVNPDVFSRIAPRASTGLYTSPVPLQTTTQFHFSAGAGGIAPNDAAEFYAVMSDALAKRREGYPVKIVVVPEGHAPEIGSEAPALFRWFHESWTAPDSARQVARPPEVAPLPQLTSDALERWTAFWTRFMQEPDAIRDSARAAHAKEFPVLVGREPVTLLMTDIPALAAKYPAVAADLEAAGLTAREAEAYRLALFSTWTVLNMQDLERSDDEYLTQVRRYGTIVGDVAPTSVLGQNLAFLRAQPALLKSLKEWTDHNWTSTP